METINPNENSLVLRYTQIPDWAVVVSTSHIEFKVFLHFNKHASCSNKDSDNSKGSGPP